MESDILSEIKKHATAKSSQDNTSYNAISVADVTRLSQLFGINGRRIEITALENGIIPERYIRNMKTFSPDDQAALLRSHVSVVGLGGLGGGVVEILSRIGVGKLTLIDGDRFEDSNLNRQFLSATDLIGRPKADAALKRASAVNPSLSIDPKHMFLEEQNAVSLLEHSDVVVDCLDSLKTRFILEKASKTINCPLVSAAVAGVSGHVTTIFPEDRGLELIYGEREDLAKKGAEASLGTLPQAVTVLSCLECSETIKIILKKGTLLRNKLLVIDLMDNTLEVLNLV